MSKTKSKKQRKAYKPKAVNRIPMILLGLEASEDRVKKLADVARSALLKLHYEAATEQDYYVLIQSLFVGYRLSQQFEERDALREIETKGIVTVVELEQRQKRGEILLRSKITDVEDALNMALEQMSKARLYDVLDADSYFDAHHEEIVSKLRELVVKAMNEDGEGVKKLDEEGK